MSVRPCVLQSVSSKEVSGRLAVQRELAGAVSGHADAHETQQHGHARHRRGLPVLHHSLGCLSLKERAGVTTHTATTTATGRDHRRGLRKCVSGLPPGSGCSRVLKEATLVTHLSHPSEGLAIREETHYNLHFCQVSIQFTVSPLQVWRHL